MNDPSTKPPSLFLIRHGQTLWSQSGQHTGRSDIPLTDQGRRQAALMKDILAQIQFSLVLTSPLSRAVETAALAGLGGQAQVCPQLAEMDYGDYEGLTSAQIRQTIPDWTIWTHLCPGGETLEQAGQRAAESIATALSVTGNVALFAHGHILRILTAVYLGMPPTAGSHFMLDTCSLSLLSHEREARSIRLLNCPANLPDFLRQWH